MSRTCDTDNPPLSVLVVDDQPAVVHLLRMWIDDDDRFVLAATAADGRAAVREAEAECPDAVICDMDMPEMTGAEVVPILRRMCPDTVIVVYTSDRNLATKAGRLGADAVLDKGTTPVEVLDVLAELHRRR